MFLLNSRKDGGHFNLKAKQNLNFISQAVRSYIFLTIQDGGRRYVELHGSSNAVSYVVWIDVMNTKFGSNISNRFGDMGLSFCQYDGSQSLSWIFTNRTFPTFDDVNLHAKF